jgi:hypothetical protein
MIGQADRQSVTELGATTWLRKEVKIMFATMWLEKR